MIDIILKNVKTLTAIFLVSAAATYLLAWVLITPQYESMAVIFPPNTHANMHLIGAGIRFGHDKEVGEHMEILKSNEVRNAMVERFNLVEEFKIDLNNKYFEEELRKTYDKHISFNRTVNKSIEITVRASNPALAAEMANQLVVIADKHKSQMVKENVRLAAKSAEKNYRQKETLIQEMTDSLEALRKAGESVWTYGEERKSSRYQNYELQYRKHLDRYLDLKLRWEELQNLLDENVPTSYLVSTAIPSSKPAYPNKSMLALLAGIACVLMFLSLKTFLKIGD